MDALQHQSDQKSTTDISFKWPNNCFERTNPDIPLFGKSIWVGSPLTTILEFSPIRS